MWTTGGQNIWKHPYPLSFYTCSMLQQTTYKWSFSNISLIFDHVTPLSDIVFQKSLAVLHTLLLKPRWNQRWAINVHLNSTLPNRLKLCITLSNWQDSLWWRASGPLLLAGQRAAGGLRCRVALDPSLPSGLLQHLPELPLGYVRPYMGMLRSFTAPLFCAASTAWRKQQA